MSISFLANPSLVLLIASLTQALWHALAFCRAPGARALGAPRAHVLHVRAPSRGVAPLAFAHSAEPRPTLDHSPKHAKLCLVPYSAAVRAPWRHAGVRSELLPRPALPEPQPRASCPWSSPSLSPRSSTSTRRCHDALPQQKWSAGDLILGDGGTDLAAL